MTNILKRNKVKELFNDNNKQITPKALEALDILVHKKIINLVRRSSLIKGRVTDDDILLLFDDKDD